MTPLASHTMTSVCPQTVKLPYLLHIHIYLCVKSADIKGDPASQFLSRRAVTAAAAAVAAGTCFIQYGFHLEVCHSSSQSSWQQIWSSIKQSIRRWEPCTCSTVVGNAHWLAHLASTNFLPNVFFSSSHSVYKFL